MYKDRYDLEISCAGDSSLQAYLAGIDCALRFDEPGIAELNRKGQTAMEFGATPSPSDCWLTSMGLKTFPVRMERHASNALAVAEFLEGHGKIQQVLYPGLESNRFHELAKRQMFNGFGGFMSFEVAGDKKAAHRLIEALNLPTIAISFGSTDSVIQLPASMTHSGISAKDRATAGISDNLVRFCVGIEDIEDILDDFEQALKVV